jgi:serine/threonine-protein kinase RsbW
VLPGVPQAAGMARAVVAQALGPGHPAAADAAVCVSELAANAVCHTRSGQPGGTFTVSVQAGRGVVRIAVADAGSGTRPRAMRARRGAFHGRGLAIVAALSAAWGCERAGGGQITWCEFPRAER